MFPREQIESKQDKREIEKYIETVVWGQGGGGADLIRYLTILRVLSLQIGATKVHASRTGGAGLVDCEAERSCPDDWESPG